MNLALKDVRHDSSRFLLTAVGLGLLLTVVLAMTGIYNGIIVDATALPDSLEADLWVVQRNTRGPFAEISRISDGLEERARAVPGVASARTYVSHTIQRELPDGQPLRFNAVGLSWPDDRGGNLPITEGRALGQAHYEFLVDRSLGLPLGQRVTLGRDEYVVVGITDGMLASGGDPVAFFTRSDAQSIQNDQSNEALRLEREARSARVRDSAIGRDPELLRLSGEASVIIPAIAPPSVAAVMVNLAPGASLDNVRARLQGWQDVSVYTQAEQHALILGGVVEKTRRQIGLFRGLLVVISAILMGLIIYTMTVDKLHSIALLKLLGARTTVILGMILQESLLLGGIAYVLALIVGNAAFHLFPRRVVVGNEHRLLLLGIVIAISIAASVVGMRKALAADPNEALAG
ncbi:MAG: putative ABC transport system permease protein [Chlamydiales bacterium]